MSADSLIFLCQQDAISDPGTLAFEITPHGQLIEGILVHWHGRWFAYRNACPHTGVNLNWPPADFFDLERRYLQCSLHGALFEPASGYCIYGPCNGETLMPLPIRVEGDGVYYAG